MNENKPVIVVDDTISPELMKALREQDHHGVTPAFVERYNRPPTEADRIAIEKAEAKRAMRAAKRAKVAK